MLIFFFSHYINTKSIVEYEPFNIICFTCLVEKTDFFFLENKIGIRRNLERKACQGKRITEMRGGK